MRAIGQQHFATAACSRQEKTLVTSVPAVPCHRGPAYDARTIQRFPQTRSEARSERIADGHSGVWMTQQRQGGADRRQGRALAPVQDMHTVAADT